MHSNNLIPVAAENLPLNTLKVLEVLYDFIRRKKRGKSFILKDVFASAAKKEKAKNKVYAKHVGKQCLPLMQQAIYNHRFIDAAKLLYIMCNDTSVNDLLLFQIGFIVLQNLDDLEDKEKTVVNFFKQAQYFKYVVNTEAQLEYLIYGISNQVDNLQEQTDQWFLKKNFKENSEPHTSYSIFQAYCTYLNYVTWLCSKGSLSQSNKEIESIFLLFQIIIKTPGNWDIFVLKMFELLKYMSESDPEKSETEELVNFQGEMQKTLVQYAYLNPENLNAYIYLCYFLSLYDPESELLKTHLQKISEMSPSDERVLLLIDRLDTKGRSLIESLKLIFRFLDYPSNSKNVEAWLKLSKLLQISRKQKTTKEEIDILWDYRKKIWLWMYFNPKKVSAENNATLAHAKVKVLKLLEKSHPFVKEISKSVSIKNEVQEM